ncbi:methyltransferase domain-containing protein [Nocardia abscessus]|nr:methyltransferase domain-containing protein [Nocardia abscessus]
MPFAANAFDVVLLIYHLIESILPAAARESALLEAARVLNPAGSLFLTRHQTRAVQIVAASDRPRYRKGRQFRRFARKGPQSSRRKQSTRIRDAHPLLSGNASTGSDSRPGTGRYVGF